MAVAVDHVGAKFAAQVAKPDGLQKGSPTAEAAVPPKTIQPASACEPQAPRARPPSHPHSQQQFQPRQQRGRTPPPPDSSTELTPGEADQLLQLLLHLGAGSPASSSSSTAWEALVAALGDTEQQQSGTCDARQVAQRAISVLQALAAGEVPTAQECRAAHCLLACISSAVASLPAETHIPHDVLAAAAKRGLHWNQRRRTSGADDPAPLGQLFDLRPKGAAAVEAGMRLKLADWRWAAELGSSGSGHRDRPHHPHHHHHQHHHHPHHQHQHHHRHRHAAETDEERALAAEEHVQRLQAQLEDLQAALEAARAAEAAAAEQVQVAQAAQHQGAAELAAELDRWKARAEAAEAALAAAAAGATSAAAAQELSVGVAAANDGWEEHAAAAAGTDELRAGASLLAVEAAPTMPAVPAAQAAGPAQLGACFGPAAVGEELAGGTDSDDELSDGTDSDAASDATPEEAEAGPLPLHRRRGIVLFGFALVLLLAR